MPLPLVPIAIAGVVGLAAWKATKKKGMTPERKKIFDAAMRTLNDPVKLRTLADSFEKEGLKAEAGELRKRAAIFSAPKSVLEERKKVFKKAMDSKNPSAIKKVAAAFHKVGHYEAASKLRSYAKGFFKPTASPGKVGFKLGVHGEEDFAGAESDSAAEV